MHINFTFKIKFILENKTSADIKSEKYFFKVLETLSLAYIVKDFPTLVCFPDICIFSLSFKNHYLNKMS